MLKLPQIVNKVRKIGMILIFHSNHNSFVVVKMAFILKIAMIHLILHTCRSRLRRKISCWLRRKTMAFLQKIISFSISKITLPQSIRAHVRMKHVNSGPMGLLIIQGSCFSCLWARLKYKQRFT